MNEKHRKQGKVELDDVNALFSQFYILLMYLPYITTLVPSFVKELCHRLAVLLGISKPRYEKPPQGYAPVIKPFDYIYLTCGYQHIRDLFERPIASVPGSYFCVLERYSEDHNRTFNYTGKQTKCLNLASYNYLGFAENSGPVADAVVENLEKYSIAAASPRSEVGLTESLAQLESEIAKFVGKPAAIVISMGFATNSTTIPVLCGKGTLIISDKLNHNSIVTGSRAAGPAYTRVFKHNDMEDLEKVLKDSIVEGQPRTRRPWEKIIIVVEGTYSMEGEACKLPEIVAIKKKYKAYLYVDEAHSIGALGQNGRGICEYWGVNPDSVDVLMGTFTKAFASVGGYVAGSAEFISYLKHCSAGSVYGTAMSPPCVQQVLSALKILHEGSGMQRTYRLRTNGNYVRRRLLEEGFHVFGDWDSPVILIMLYFSALMPAFSRELLSHGIAVAVVGFPVTPPLLCRIRLCISAAHDLHDLEKAVQIISRMGDNFGAKHAKYANYHHPDLLAAG